MTSPPRNLPLAPVIVLAVACMFASVVAISSQVDTRPAPESAGGADDFCGTDLDFRVSRGLAESPALADGYGVFVDQTPRILTPELTGSFSLQAHIVGDLASVQFDRSDPEAASRRETWQRTGTRTAGGRVVSIFDTSYPAAELARLLRRQAWGFDDGGILWGSLVLPDGETSSINLRISSSNLPAATVVRLGPDVQYARSVVNIRIPGYGDSRITKGQSGYDLDEVTRKFYEYFPDSYEVITMIAQSTGMTVGFDAAHRVVKNEISGIGSDLIDDSARYGSGGTLIGVELFSQTSFTTLLTTDHELTHQWSDHFVMSRLARVPPKGHQPAGHSAMLVGPPTLVGAVLKGTRYAAATGTGYEIRQSAYPILQHPMQMYALGKITAAELGPQLVFEEQGQFSEDGAAIPDPGTKIQGGVREVSVGTILGALGPRSGPSPTVVRRAAVLVSRDELASQAEMNYWNFYSQRVADPNRTGVPSFDGYVSFDRATNNTVDLQTDIITGAGTTAGPLVEVTTPRFGRTDWNGIRFDDTVPSRFVAGQNVRLSGQVTTTERTDYSEVRVRFRKAGAGSTGQVLLRSDVSRSSAFSVDVNFTPAQRGLYSMEVLVVSPAGVQVRGIVTPILVE